MVESPSAQHSGTRQILTVILASAGLLAFCVLFLLVDQTYFRFISSHFPRVGSSFWLATLWGVLSRAPWVLLLLPLALLRPRLLGLQLGQTFNRWPFVVAMITVNCGVVALFLFIGGSSTPYSGNQWLVTEIVLVPLIEELFWRGLVFSVLLALLLKSLPSRQSLVFTIWAGGIAFGLLHAANALAGVPLPFVAIQTINAVIWGVVYSYSRAMTESVYPSVVSHAAMNLIVIAF